MVKPIDFMAQNQLYNGQLKPKSLLYHPISSKLIQVANP